MILADTSVWARKKNPAIVTWFSSALIDGEIAMAEMIALEILHSARNAREYSVIETDLRALPWLPMNSAVCHRALEVSGLLAAKGQAHHRSVKHADLFIAAAAEVHGAELVHYDQDFDSIARVTGQSARWVAKRGSL